LLDVALDLDAEAEAIDAEIMAAPIRPRRARLARRPDALFSVDGDAI
jgi:hypothetical protein